MKKFIEETGFLIDYEKLGKPLLKSLLSFLLLITSISVYADVKVGDKINNKYDLVIDGSAVNSDLNQQLKSVSGVVTDADGNPIPGATVVESGTNNGTITKTDGTYSIDVRSSDAVLAFSFIGMKTKEVSINGKETLNVVLESENVAMEEVVVVGYGTQKKASVVGSITQAKGDDLMKAGGVSTVGEALQGKLPGVTTIYSNSTPGENEPLIYIRGQSSWNDNGQPLILVDGMERSMNDIDMNEIENISVLKDASATAVYGVKGGNGVILITTKRGQVGKTKLSVSGNTTFKFVSKLPQAVDAYDGIKIGNEAITREMLHAPSWGNYMPEEIADRYRNPRNEADQYIYPNVDWHDQMLKDFATDYRANLSVQGGTKKAQYFASFSYQHVSDIFDINAFDNGRGYESQFKYDRFNYRSNLDFNITKSTKFSVNLAGFYGMQKKPGDRLTEILFGLYSLAPDIYYPQYPDGSFGIYKAPEYWSQNPAVNLTSKGYDENNKLQINSDFLLEQKLDFITKGLKIKGRFSYDNNFTANSHVNDNGSYGVHGNTINKYYTEDGEEVFLLSEGVNDFRFVQLPWTLDALNVNDNSRRTRLNYELHLNYNRTFAKKHATTALLLFKREKSSRSNYIPATREDWVGRLTYNYDSRYYIDVNGAYNGSSKFGDNYRFDFFPSAAVGWRISEEAFMSDLSWLDGLKFKASYGMVGHDGSLWQNRWLDQTQYRSGGYAYMDSESFGNLQEVYQFYMESVVGNPLIHWETSIKTNYGFELVALDNHLTLDYDYFIENRKDILVSGTDRSVHDIFGADPPTANTGETEVKGHEIVIGARHRFNNGLSVNGNFSFTRAKDKVIKKEDPELRADYQKDAGFPIGTNRTPIPGDLLTSLDDLYTSIPLESGQSLRRTGYYEYLDYNGDGVYSGTYDNVPYGYTNRPENTWTASLSFNYKGWGLLVNFYGTKNATRRFDSRNLVKQQHLYFENSLGYWSVDNPDGTKILEPWTLGQADGSNRQDFYDASLVRLKTVELSYTLPGYMTKRFGIDNLKLFVNGNNLYLWTDMPDDREFNGSNIGASVYRGNYPNLRRINVGFNMNF